MSRPLPDSGIFIFELRPQDDQIYQLNWLGMVRQHPQHGVQLQVFVRLLGQERHNAFDAWVPFECFPFLILGSLWNRGTMMNRPQRAHYFTLDAAIAHRWVLPSPRPVNGRVCFGETYRLALDESAAPLLELKSQHGEILYLPLSELLRAHYFACPHVIPSLLAGLPDFKTLSSYRLEAWHYPETKWIDPDQGFAQIHRSRFLSDYDATCMARLLYDSVSRISLTALRHWVESKFIAPAGDPREERRVDLPRLSLPYREARWTAVAKSLAVEESGPRRFLILQLMAFEASEPYSQLSVIADNDKARSGRKSSLPQPVDPAPVIDDMAGGNCQGMLRNITTCDQVSRRRKPIKRSLA